jgi:CspA family cold shock protein
MIDMTDRTTGTIKWFNNAKGFGFIAQTEGADIFVHFRSIRGEGYKTLDEGQEVEFTVVEGAKGLQAEDVCKL